MPYLERDKALVERVQRRATRNVRSLRHKCYDERLQHLGLESLEKRRLLQDLTEVFKMLHGASVTSPTYFFEPNRNVTRGHRFKLTTNPSRL